ncbi:pyridoxal phosphate-dependent aminotransferase [Shewanella sp. YIC-542]|uniref:pyridoxal phosphate-dependent aminotransferase n=1 Tax=Shewanella mytili TaxID=3377111 RepID=UPI00398E71CD
MEDSDIIRHQRRHFLKLSGVLMGGGALGGLSPSVQAQPALADFTPPSAAHPIRINFNENPLGMSPKAQAVARETVSMANRYPMDEMQMLRKQLAMQHKVPEKSVILTLGATEAIRIVIEALAGPQVQLVTPELTFSAAEDYARFNGVTITRIPMAANWGIDLAAMKKAVDDYQGLSLVYLVNPNNPTGSICHADEVEAWINSKPANTLFMLDEAYAEFADDPKFRSVTPLLSAGADNIVLLKTFSKLFAMAGMRVGYAVTTEALVAKMQTRIGDNMLSYCGLKAAMASLTDTAFIDYSRTSNQTSRQILLQALNTLKIPYLPSNTNFIFHQLNVPLAEYQAHMQQAGIIVGRAFPPADNWCRVSLGTPQEMTHVASVMLDFAKKGWI